MNYERCYELVVCQDVFLKRVEHELREVVDVGSLQDVARGVRLELPFLEVGAGSNEVRCYVLVSLRRRRCRAGRRARSARCGSSSPRSAPEPRELP